MTPRNDLHLLVKSLSPAERRYFRLHARLQEPGREWNYLRLFDLLLEQESYDEEAIRARLDGSPMAKNLAVEKHYLYMLLLRVLRQFHARRRKEWQVGEMLAGVVLLMERELNDPAWNLLTRVRKSAQKHHLPLVRLQAHLLERRLLKQRNRKLLELEVDKLNETGDRLLTEVRHELEMHALYDRYSAEMQKVHHERQAESLGALDEILRHPLVTDPPEGASFQFRILRLQMLAGVAHRRQDVEKAFGYFSAIRREWEAEPGQVAAFPTRFLKVLGNYLAAARDLNKDEEVLPTLTLIRRLRRQFGLRELSAESREYLYEMLFYADQGRMEDATEVGKKLEALVEPSQDEFPLSWLLPTAFNLCVVFFLSGKFAKSLKWVNFITNLESTDKRRHLQQAAGIFRLLNHYELGNLDLLEYMVRNTGARFRRHRTLYRFESLILRTFRDLLSDARPEREKPVLLRLKAAMETGFPEKVAGFEEVGIWLSSRLEGIPIARAARNRLSRSR